VQLAGLAPACFNIHATVSGNMADSSWPFLSNKIYGSKALPSKVDLKTSHNAQFHGCRLQGLICTNMHNNANLVIANTLLSQQQQ
jgi:hypothetical protein